jgi:hypothetical protein
MTCDIIKGFEYYSWVKGTIKNSFAPRFLACSLLRYSRLQVHFLYIAILASSAINLVQAMLHEFSHIIDARYSNVSVIVAETNIIQ